MPRQLFSKDNLRMLFASGAWYSWLVWVLILFLWLALIMFLVDRSAFWSGV